MKIAFITFNQYRNIKNTAGTQLRAYNLMPYLRAEEYKAGKKYDVVICQKAYTVPDVKVKILDICDPDYLNQPMTKIFDKFDAITVSTIPLYEDIIQYTKTPVYVIKDRYNIDELPQPKKITEIKKAVWFGRSDNFEAIEQAIPSIKRLNLQLTIIADTCYNTSVIKVNNVTFPGWNEKYYKLIQEHDIAILPKLTKGRFKYKSDNKKVLAEMLGLPVAETEEELENIIKYPEKIENNSEWLRGEYNCEKSVDELLKIINEYYR